MLSIQVLVYKTIATKVNKLLKINILINFNQLKKREKKFKIFLNAKKLNHKKLQYKFY